MPHSQRCNIFISSYYIEEDIQIPILTPNLLVLSQTPVIPNKDSTEIENKKLLKRQIYIQRCTKTAWKWCWNEYLTTLCERHHFKEAEKFRPGRNISEIARVSINDLANDEREGPFNE